MCQLFGYKTSRSCAHFALKAQTMDPNFHIGKRSIGVENMMRLCFHILRTKQRKQFNASRAYACLSHRTSAYWHTRSEVSCALQALYARAIPHWQEKIDDTRTTIRKVSYARRKLKAELTPNRQIIRYDKKLARLNSSLRSTLKLARCDISQSFFRINMASRMMFFHQLSAHASTYYYSCTHPYCYFCSPDSHYQQ